MTAYMETPLVPQYLVSAKITILSLIFGQPSSALVQRLSIFMHDTISLYIAHVPIATICQRLYGGW